MSLPLYDPEKKAQLQPALDRQANLVPPSGKPQFTPVEWPNHELRDRFSAAVLELIRGVSRDDSDPEVWLTPQPPFVA